MLYIGSTAETIATDSVLIIGPGVYHSISIQPDRPLQRFFMQFSIKETKTDENPFQSQESREIVNVFSDIQYKLLKNSNPGLTTRIIK